MIRARDPFGSALEWLREEVRDGRLGAGQPLITTDLAAALRISVTPVREALSRLAGEGLIEEKRGRGFFIWRLAAADIEEHYRLHGAYADVALQLRREQNGRAETMERIETAASEDTAAFRSRTERFWAALVHGSDSEVLARAHRRLSDQLARVRLVEPAVLSECTAELSALASLAAGTDVAAFEDAVVVYHRRRVQKSRALAAALRDPAPPQP